jgi:outer membrane protein, multidrug efflux system
MTRQLATSPKFKSVSPRLKTLSMSLALILTGCATPVLQSTVDVPSQFAAAPVAETEPDVAWWESFGDPVLTELIGRAARENRDIKIAVERVRAARGGETISRSSLFPSIGARAGAADNSTGYGDAVKRDVPDAETGTAALGVSWELDLSGRLRAGTAAAAADTIATEDVARGVRLLVLGDVATSYFTLVGALEQLETVRAISAAEDETLRLVTARQRAGLASPFDVERARTDASTARATIPPLETLAAVARHRIAVLVGDQAFNAASIVPWGGATIVPEVVPGQPADLLERRPDLLAAHARLEAANFRRRQAAAEWFPRLFVSALFGRQSLGLNDNGLGTARFTNASALLTTPIFDFGRTRAINEIAESGQSEALLRYEDAIVRALEDVENTLVALRDERTRSELLTGAAASAEAALGRAQSLYDRGQIDLLPLLDAQRARLSVRINANESNTKLRLDSVQLFKALGGGWQLFEPGAAPVASAVRSSDSPTLVSTNEDPS